MFPPPIPVLLDRVDELVAPLWMSLKSSQLSTTLDAARSVATSVNAAYSASFLSMLNWLFMSAMATSVPQQSFVNPATASNVIIALMVMVITAGSLVFATRSRTLKIVSFFVMVIGSLCTLVVLAEILPPVLLIPRPPTVRTILYSANLYLRTLHIAHTNATRSGWVHGSSGWASIVLDTIDWSRVSFKTRFVALTRAGMFVDLSGARHTEVVKIWHVGPWCSFQELLCVASHAIRCFVVVQSKRFGLSLGNVPCAGINGYQWMSAWSDSLVSTISVAAIAGFFIMTFYKLVIRFAARSSNPSVKIENASLGTSTITSLEQDLCTASSDLASLSADHQNLLIHLAHSSLTIADLQWRLDRAERELKNAKSENMFLFMATCGARKSTPVKSRYVNRSRSASTPLNRWRKTRSTSLPATPVLSSTSSFGLPTLTPSSSISGAQLQAVSTPTPIKRARAAYRAHVALNVRRLISRRLAKSAQDARPLGNSSSISPRMSSSTSESFETSAPPSPTPVDDNHIDHDVRLQAGINMRNVLLARVASAREVSEAAVPSPSPSASLSFSETVSTQLSSDLGNDVVQVIEAPIPQPLNTAEATTSRAAPSKPGKCRRKERSSSSKLLQNSRTVDDVMMSIKAEHTRMWSRDGGTAETQDTVPIVERRAARGRLPRSRLASRLPSTPAPIRIPSASSSPFTSSSASASSSRSSSTPTSSSTSASSIDSSRWQHDKFLSPSPSPLRTGTARTMLAKSLRDALSGGSAGRTGASAV